MKSVVDAGTPAMDNRCGGTMAHAKARETHEMARSNRSGPAAEGWSAGVDRLALQRAMVDSGAGSLTPGAVRSFQGTLGNRVTNGLITPSRSGRALPEGLRASMERSFGRSFGDVRIHEDGRAEAYSALAVTSGRDIHFARGQFRPDTQRGRELIGHELTHVVQQAGSSSVAQGKAGDTSSANGLFGDSELEEEADDIGGRAGRGESVTGLVVGRTNGIVAQGKTEDGTTGAALDRFYEEFSRIKVHYRGNTIEVIPPYHINKNSKKRKRKKNAEKARKKNKNVQEMLDNLELQRKIHPDTLKGKAQPSELKVILEAAVRQGLVEHEENAMHAFLSTYGLSVDCSGYVSQALNYLGDGNMTIDARDRLKARDTHSSTLKGGTPRFKEVKIERLQEGDTMHLKDHIRIVNEVVKEGDIIYFRTTESTGIENKKTRRDGLMTRWWKYQRRKLYFSWESQQGSHPDAGDRSWKRSKETNTFGRLKSITKNKRKYRKANRDQQSHIGTDKRKRNDASRTDLAPAVPDREYFGTIEEMELHQPTVDNDVGQEVEEGR